MANDTNEEFWGCVLGKDKKGYIWDPSADSEEDVEHKLQLTTACLGHKAKDGERNLVEVTTEDGSGTKITCSILSLRIGGKECAHLDLGFTSTTKFTLKEGNGPLSLCGVHLQALPLDFDEDESDEDGDVPDLVQAKVEKKETKTIKEKEESKKQEKKTENNTENKVEKKEGKTATKRPLPDKKDEQPAKKKKPVVTVDDSDEEDDDEDEEEGSDNNEDEEESDQEMPSLLDGEAEESDDGDSDEGDDEPEAGDDVDSEDEDEDDDEDTDSDEDDDSEEEISVKKPANRKVNGHVSTKTTTPGRGVQKDTKKDIKTAAKDQKEPNNKKTPTGRKENTTTPKSQAKKTPEEIKAYLLKSPNLPKKFDKFSNFMKNNLKVTDSAALKEFWEYIQKNKK